VRRTEKHIIDVKASAAGVMYGHKLSMRPKVVEKAFLRASGC
jgi:hypothetical protein